jgi:hypothetical protein
LQKNALKYRRKIKLKKLVIIIMCLAMMLGSMALISCGDSKKCEHQWGEWSYMKMPTCELEGEEMRTCTVCSGIQLRKVSTLPHDYKVGGWTWDDGKENAFVLLVCSDNKLHRSSAKGEITTSVKVAPTCGESGVNTITATYVHNGETYTDTVEVTVPATGNHTFANGVCTVCGSNQ